MYNTAVAFKDLGEPGPAPDALGQSCNNYFAAGQGTTMFRLYRGTAV